MRSLNFANTTIQESGDRQDRGVVVGGSKLRALALRVMRLFTMPAVEACCLYPSQSSCGHTAHSHRAVPCHAEFGAATAGRLDGPALRWRPESLASAAIG